MLPDGKVYYRPANALKITDARLKIADFDESKPVRKNAKGITFEVNPDKGHATMHTWLSGRTIKKHSELSTSISQNSNTKTRTKTHAEHHWSSVL